MFPALDPITLREKRAKEVFLLFKRTTKLNSYINKTKEEMSDKKSKKSNKVVDVTGIDNGWF